MYEFFLKIFSKFNIKMYYETPYEKYDEIKYGQPEKGF